MLVDGTLDTRVDVLLRMIRVAGKVVLESGSVEVRAKAVEVEGLPV